MRSVVTPGAAAIVIATPPVIPVGVAAIPVIPMRARMMMIPVTPVSLVPIVAATLMTGVVASASPASGTTTVVIVFGRRATTRTA